MRRQPVKREAVIRSGLVAKCVEYFDANQLAWVAREPDMGIYGCGCRHSLYQVIIANAR